MKTLSITVFMILFSYLLYGQDKEINVLSIESYNNWTEQYKDLCDQLNITYLPKDTNNFWFRFVDNHQFTDLWTNDFKCFNGLITTSAYYLNAKSKSNKEGRLFYSKQIIDTAKAKQIYNLLIHDSIIQILVKNYTANKDSSSSRSRYEGHSFRFEISSRNSFTMITYEEDYLPDTLSKDRLAINSFVKLLKTELSLDKSYIDFFSTLPFGTYSDEGYSVIINTRKSKHFIKRHSKKR